MDSSSHRSLIDDSCFITNQLKGLCTEFLDGSSRGKFDQTFPVGFIPFVILVRDAVVQLLRPCRNDPRLANAAQKREIELEWAVVRPLVVTVKDT